MTLSGHHRTPISGTFPSTVATGDAITGSGIPSGHDGPPVSGGPAHAVQAPRRAAPSTVRITTTSTLAVGPGHADRRADPHHGRQHAPRAPRPPSPAIANSRACASGGCSSNMDTNAASDPNPVTTRGDNATAARRAGEQLGPDRPVRPRVTSHPGLRRPGDRGRRRPCTSSPTACTTPTLTRRPSTINGTSYSGHKVTRTGVDPRRATAVEQLLPDGTDPVQHLQHEHRSGLDGWIPELDL